MPPALPANVVPFVARFDAEVIVRKVIDAADNQEKLAELLADRFAAQAQNNHLLRAHALKVCVFEQLMVGARFKAFGFRTAHDMLDFVKGIYLESLV